MSNFSPPRDTPAPKSSAVPKRASSNLKSPLVQLPTTAEPTITTDVPPVESIQQDQQQPLNASRLSQNDTNTFTFDPLESAPPRPWNLSDTPPYIPNRRSMTSPTSNPHLPDLEPSSAPVRLPTPTEPDLSKEEPEVDPEEQAQHMSSLVKDILRHHYKDDPFLCNLLNQASVKITENTTNETLELELEGTNHSVSPTQPITIRIE